MEFELDREKSQWRSFADGALTEAKKQGAQYTDVRIVLLDTEYISTESFEEGPAAISSSDRSVDASIGVRVIVDGVWGFAGMDLLQDADVEKLVKRAVDSARGNASLQRDPVSLAPPSARDKEFTYTSPLKKDPFAVPWEEKIKLLLDADTAMREISPKIFKRTAALSFRKMKKVLATSDGIFAVQEFLESGAVVQAEARDEDGGDIQRRSYPDSHVHYTRGGWEEIERMDLIKHAAEMAREAEILLSAPPCPYDERDIILLPTMANLHCGHETIHGFEADRVLGTEWTLAGGSFITAILPEIGNFRFGSEHVNIVADSTEPSGVGTFACDDEGTPGQRNYLVKDGILTGLLTSRETVPWLNRVLGKEYFKESGGTMRAMHGACSPLIRMVNIIIEPGDIPFEKMKDDAKEGTIMFGTNKSWSIDDVRRHFNFGTEIAWEKKGGKWEPRKNASYSGDNLEFFRGCMGFADKESFVMHGIGNCGKDISPVQTIPTGHGTSPGWFKEVKVKPVGLGKTES